MDEECPVDDWMEKRALKEWQEKKANRRLSFTAHQLRIANEVLPDYCLDDDWPDMQDRLAGELSEDESLGDTADDIARELMIDRYSY